MARKLFILDGSPKGNPNASRQLKAGLGINIATSGHDATISSNVTGSNIGSSGVSLFSAKSGAFLQFKKIVGGDGIVVHNDGNTITIRLA